MKKVLILFLLLSCAVVAPGCHPAMSRAGAYTIAVIPKGTTHEFWKSIHAGAAKAERELNDEGLKVSIIWKGPLREDDREQQVQVVEGFLSQNVSGIVLAPLDNLALVRPVEEAKRANIPTVIIDSGLNSSEIISFVATDNLKGGMVAAERVGTLLDGKGKVLLLRYQEGSASTHDREEGFLQKLRAAYPGIEIISSDQYAGPTRDSAFRASQNLLNHYGNDIQAVFTPNESATAGMLLALQDINKAGKIKHVGFDATGPLLDALRNRQLEGLVIQDPFKMGYLGVRTMVDFLQGKSVEQRVDTGVYLITPDNLDDPQFKSLLHPPTE
jgi:ribose transport system substrate-binding protein